ncbi:polymer-forming cytoskeletal protein [Maricaulis parjimensis]|uniref:polymer-forming cytoskeletal protein n=1 Tax=Maricaulis parjimensis TaxID=144023 RepID=UPI0019394A53|nr:polymer-forming cytoskeletal protein [Maricaulis parjimensis]
MNIKRYVMALGLAIGLGTSAVSAQMIGGEVDIDGHRSDVIFLGGELTVRGDVQGDVAALAGEGDIDANVSGSINFLGGDLRIRGTVGDEIEIAGGDVEIQADVGGDVAVAGGDVNVSGTVGGSLSAAGGSVEIDAIVEDRAHLAGGAIRVSSASQMRNGVELAGGEVELHGLIDGDLDAEAAEISIAGTITGNVEIRAEEVYILDTARIDGVLEIRSPVEPVIAPNAQIGDLDYQFEAFNFGAKHWDDIDIEIDGPWELIGAPFAFLGFAIPGAALLLGFLAVVMAPNGISRVARTFRRQPLVSGFVGFIAFAFSPVMLVVLTVLLAITVIGVVLIPFLWVLFWPFLLLCLGMGAMAVGDLIFNRDPETPLGLGMRLLSLLLVLAGSAALGVIPGLGAIVGLFLVFIGFGAWMLSLGQKEPVAPVSPGGTMHHDNTVTQG